MEHAEPEKILERRQFPSSLRRLPVKVPATDIREHLDSTVYVRGDRPGECERPPRLDVLGGGAADGVLKQIAGAEWHAERIGDPERAPHPSGHAGSVECLIAHAERVVAP